MTKPDHSAPRAAAQLAREDGRGVFGTGAAGYHAIRAGYPDELFDHLHHRAGKVDAVLEIGPGSGIATQALLRRSPRRYVAVESDPDFVAFLQARYQRPEVELICSPFPCRGLAGPFDLAACAAAFHWLEPETSLAAIKRLLRPTGIWAMWWNSYLDETDDHPFAQAAMALMRERGVRLPPSFGPKGHRSLDFERQIAQLEANGFRDVDQRRWRCRRVLEAGSVRELFESFSFVRLLPQRERSALLEALDQIVTRRFGGVVDSWTSTSCYTGRPA